MTSSQTVSDYVDERIKWCRRRATAFRTSFMLLKASQILFAATIPVVALASPSHSQPILNGILGSFIIVIEGLQHTFRLQTYWVRYRHIERNLIRERILYAGNGGPYQELGEDDASRRFAERIEAMLGDHQRSWEELTESLGGEKPLARAAVNAKLSRRASNHG